MRTFKIRVRGVKPLLMHRFGLATQTDLESKTKKRSTGAPPAAEEAEEGAYRLTPQTGDPVWNGNGPQAMQGKTMGQLCLPSEHFFQSMATAASNFKVQGQGKKTYKEATRGNLEVCPDYIGLIDPESGDKLFYYEVDSRPVRIQSSRVMRRRPILTKWAAEFEITVFDPQELPDEVLQHILEKAGQAKGVGDYRPRFGQFTIERFELVKADPEDEVVLTEEVENGGDLNE